jgi:predicted DsbA family dithiol-disulfide isomerase
VVCPWCYLGKRRFERALESFAHRDEVEVVFRSFELDPGAPAGVTTPTAELLASKYRMTPEQADASQREMEQRAALEGLEFRMGELRSGNTRDAHRLLHLAKARGVQADLAERLHAAYFTEQKSVFDRDSLAEIATGAGLDPDEVRRVLDSDEYGDAVDTDEAMAQALGATGVPLFVIDRRYGISGAQEPALIQSTLDRAWAEAGTGDTGTGDSGAGDSGAAG